MGRPPLSPNDVTARTTVRAPACELASAREKAHARGLPLAEWTRELWRDALGAEEYLAAVALPDEDGLEREEE
jgi:muconolactone delta-isomerase